MKLAQAFGAVIVVSGAAVALVTGAVHCGTSSSANNGNDAGSSGSSGGSSSSSGSTSSSSSGGGPVVNNPIVLNDTTCSWEGGVPSLTSATKNTDVLAAPSASYANKLNPKCEACPTSPTADEPTGCPMYTTPATVTPGSMTDFPSVGFSATYDLGAMYNQPIYIPNDVVIPTIDDVPDGADSTTGTIGNDGYTPGNWTRTDLAFLDSIHFQMDFFMNDNNWVTVTSDPTSSSNDPNGYSAYVDIIKNHFPANHTADHSMMGNVPSWLMGDAGSCFPYTPTQAQCCDCPLCPTTDCTTEIQSIDTLAAAISNNGRPHLTRFRMPYGVPVEPPALPNSTSVQAKVAKFAVWAGWHFLTHDADNTPCGCSDPDASTCTCVDESKGNICCSDSADPSCGANAAGVGPYDNGNADYQNFVTAIGSGPGKGTAWGIGLMHGTTPWTAAALRKLLGPAGYISTTTYRIGTIEDAICWKYGMHSWDVVNKYNGYTGPACKDPATDPANCARGPN
jgi:hypothetical protein